MGNEKNKNYKIPQVFPLIRIKHSTMNKSITVFILLYSFTILPKNFSAIAQDSTFFSKERQSDAKIEPFCNNSPEKDFAPFVWNDYVFITSSRINPKSKNKIDPITKQPFLNVFGFDMNCKAVDLEFLPSTLNNNLNCGPVTIARDTSLLVITKNYPKPNKERIQNLYLTFYVRDKNKWSEEKLFPFNDINHSLQHPYFDDQTKTLYFSSDIPGGYGKFDLYKSRWDGKNWSKPENLGPEINTSYNEVFPSLSPGGGLFYSCDQRGTSGGLDIIFYRNKTRYLLPEPFNTLYDDFSISFINQSSGYLASNRDRSTPEDNIYSFEIVSSFVIRVLDRETKMPIQDVSIAFQTNNPPLNGHVLTSDAGEGIIYQGSKDPFSVSLELKKEGYQQQSIVSKNFMQEDNFWVMTVSMESVQEAVITEDNEPSDYYIIVGSFRNQKYAQRRAKQLRTDFKQNIVILPRSVEGYYRLSNGIYPTHDAALAASEDFKINNNADAWILRVKK